MSIYKRGEHWWIQFTTPDGRRIQRTAGTINKQEAQELHDQLKAEMWRVKNLGDKPRHTWEEAVVRWLNEQSHKKSLATDKERLRWLDRHLLKMALTDIDKKKLAFIRDTKKAEGAANATVNRHLAVISGILNKACKEWDWIDTVPSIKMLPEPSGRIRWITPEEAQRLISELPPHLEAMARFALATGLREANVTGLLWSQLDMQRRCAWIHADQAKGKKSFVVPLNDDALAVIRGQIGKHQTHVFCYEGNPIKKANTKAYKNALERAGIQDFTWHDLRHTWASWHVQNGTPINVLKELGGWADLSMVLKYAHLSGEHLNAYARNSSFVNMPVETNLLHSKKEA